VTALADLHLELLRRNARLRAWRAYGIPVEGGWTLSEEDLPPLLALSCRECGAWLQTCPPRRTLRQTADIFREESRAITGSLRSQGCPHLAPLLGADPPEVKAIAELELLAG
jgi:hypothetical protein